VALYLIGDVQGCYRTFSRLFESISFDPLADELWLAGDLVNRGPRSLDMLRWVHANRDVVKIVLGNHDLHLIMSAVGLRRPKARDTLEPVLEASDSAMLVDWLRCQPLLQRRDELMMVHAGVLPTWTPAEVERRAAALEGILQSDDYATRLSALGDEDAETLAVLTRVRMLDGDGRPDSKFTGAPEDAPPSLAPWFATLDSSWDDVTLAFGHWAALGVRFDRRWISLDSACVWGRSLTAVRYPERRVFEVPNED